MSTATNDVGEAKAKLTAEEAIDDRVDAAVRGSEPLRHRNQHVYDQARLTRVALVKRSSEIDAQIDGVERQPEGRKQNDDDDHHLQDLHLRLVDDSRNVCDSWGVPVPNTVADQRIEDGYEEQRYREAGQENAEKVALFYLLRRPLLSTDVDLLARRGNVEMPIVEDPGRGYRSRTDPDEGDHQPRHLSGCSELHHVTDG